MGVRLVRVTHLSKQRANELNVSSLIYFHSISQPYKCIGLIKMLNDHIDFKEAVYLFFTCVSPAESLIYWCVKASCFINPLVERKRKVLGKPNRVQGDFLALLIKYPIMACGAMALLP